MGKYGRIMDTIYSAGQGIAMLCLMACMTLLFVQTALRFCANISLSWAEELCRYLAIWMTFIGAGVGVRKGIHVGFDILKTKLKGKANRILNSILYLTIFGFSFILFAEGFRLTRQSVSQTSSSLGFPMSYVYSSLIVGAVLFILFSLEGIINIIKGGEKI